MSVEKRNLTELSPVGAAFVGRLAFVERLLQNTAKTP